MNRKPLLRKCCLFTTFSLLTFLFTTCGLYEYYYLPQVSQGNIIGYSDTSVSVVLPNIADEYYFANGYIIFYRIYLSNYDAPGSIITPDQRSSISSSLAADFTFFSPYTDPTNNILVTSSRLFSDRGYYWLELESGASVINLLTSSGGSLSIQFTLDSSQLTINGNYYPIYRYTFIPGQNRSFSPLIDLNTDDGLNDLARLDTPSQFAYVSMYLIAEGDNISNFTKVYSKPIHLNIFRLQ